MKTERKTREMDFKRTLKIGDRDMEAEYIR
jgi:hypothetical protein